MSKDDKPNDTKPTAHEVAAERAGIEADEVLKVDGAKVVHAVSRGIVDPGDANPVRTDWSGTPRMSTERPL